MTRQWIHAATLLVALLLPGGCTVEDGRGFAQLSGRLTSSFAGLTPSLGRLGADGWYKTARSFELRLSALALTVREVRLQSTEGGTQAASSACSFDPASPPPGCTLCHGGHCHCGGELKSYEELEAEACGTGAAAASRTLVTLPLQEPQPLLGEGSKRELRECVPSCELGAGSVSGVKVLLDRLQVEARLRDASAADRLAGKELAVSVDWALAGATLALSLPAAEPLGRDHPYYLSLSLALPVTEKLFDALDWYKLTVAGDRVTIDGKGNTAAGELLTTSLASSVVSVIAQRSDL